MSVATQVEILDIRHFNARQLRPLLEHEAVVWEKRLSWDYKSSTELLLQYLDSQVLPGFIAMDRGRLCGFCFCVYEGQKAIVGDAYGIDGGSLSAIALTRMLLRHLLEMLIHTPTVDRIESQLLLYPEGTTHEVFTEAGFLIYPRLFMEVTLDTLGLPLELRGETNGAAKRAAEALVVGDLALRRWSGVHYEAAAELIHECYKGHLDAFINDQYRSMHGSLRFLHNIVRFPGCGVFEPDASWLFVDRRTGALAGVVLCSKVAPKTIHITQLCIAPKFRGAGLGKLLLRHTIQHLASTGFELITLTVTEQNSPAVKLYQELGFTTRHRFEAMVLDKTRRESPPIHP